MSNTALGSSQNEFGLKTKTRPAYSRPVKHNQVLKVNQLLSIIIYSYKNLNKTQVYILLLNRMYFVAT